MPFEEVDVDLRMLNRPLVEMYEPRTPTTEGSYFLCYSCPPETKERAVVKIGEHHYCQKCAIRLLEEDPSGIFSR